MKVLEDPIKGLQDILDGDGNSEEAIRVRIEWSSMPRQYKKKLIRDLKEGDKGERQVEPLQTRQVYPGSALACR